MPGERRKPCAHQKSMCLLSSENSLCVYMASAFPNGCKSVFGLLPAEIWVCVQRRSNCRCLRVRWPCL